MSFFFPQKNSTIQQTSCDNVVYVYVFGHAVGIKTIRQYTVQT